MREAPSIQKYNAGLCSRDITGTAARFFAAAIFAMVVLGGALAGCASEPRAGDSDGSEAEVQASAAESGGAVQPLNTIDEATAAAGEVSLRKDALLQYVVKKGDTLWGIASYFLRDPWQWPQLWYVNGHVSNPHLIYPGETLTLIMVDGRTRLAGPDVVQHLSPRVREVNRDDALSAIPLEAIRNFLHGPRVVANDEIKRAPYVLEYTSEHIDGSANNGIYVMNLPKDSAETWAVMRIGDEYVDPESGEHLGFEAVPAGEAELRKAGQPAEFLITKSSREVQIGDRLFPIEKENFDTNFYPHPPTKPVDGRIISVFDGVSEIPQYQIVALNRGSKAGLDPGTVLSIYQAGRVVPDAFSDRQIKLPEQYAGILMVFKVTPKLSYALVMSEIRPVHVYDKVHQPAPH